MVGKELKGIIKHTNIYALGNILNRSASFILLPVYVNILEPKEYGLYALVAISMDIISVLLVMGMGNTLVRFYVSCESDEERHQVVSTAIIFYCALALLFLTVSGPLATLTCKILFGNTEHQVLFRSGYWALVFTALFNIQLQYLIVRKKSLLYMYTSVGKTCLFLVLNILFVVVFHWGIMGIIMGTLISSFLLAMVLLYLMLKEIHISFSMFQLKRLLKFGAPLVPAVLFDTLLQSLNRYFLNRDLSTEAVGKYALAERLTQMIRLFVANPFYQIWIVRRLETMTEDNPDSSDQLNTIFLIFITFVVWTCLGIAIFSNEIIAIIASDAYASAATLIPIMALAHVVLAIRQYFETNVFYSQKTHFLAYSSGLSLILAVPVYIIMIQEFGLFGAAWAFLITTIIRTLLIAWFTRDSAKSFSLQDWMKIAGVILAAIGWYGISYFINGNEISIMTEIIKVVLALLFIGVIYVSPIFEPQLRAELKKLILRKRNKVAEA